MIGDMWLLFACTAVVVGDREVVAPAGEEALEEVPGGGDSGNDTAVEAEEVTDEYGCSSIFDADTFPSYNVEISDDEWSDIRAEYAAYDGSKLYHPTLSFSDGVQTLTGASLRLKGNEGYSWGVGKMQMVVSFVEEDEDQRFHGVRHIAFDAPWYDTTLLHNRLATTALHELGVPAPCANSARLFINGEFYGVFAAMEQLDHEYLERNFGDDAADGNLYKYGYELANNAGADTSDMAAFWATTDPAILASLGDTAQWVDEWAAEAVISDVDGYWCCGHNYYIYAHPTQGLIFIPWDLDATYNYVGTPYVDPLAYPTYDYVPQERAILNTAEGRERFLRRVAEYRAILDPEVYAARTRNWSAQIDEAMQEDTRSYFTYATWRASVANQEEFFEARDRYLEAWLDAVE